VSRRMPGEGRGPRTTGAGAVTPATVETKGRNEIRAPVDWTPPALARRIAAAGREVDAAQVAVSAGLPGAQQRLRSAHHEWTRAQEDAAREIDNMRRVMAFIAYDGASAEA